MIEINEDNIDIVDDPQLSSIIQINCHNMKNIEALQLHQKILDGLKSLELRNDLIELQKQTEDSLQWYQKIINIRDYRNVHEEYAKAREVKIVEDFNNKLKKILGIEK